MNDAIMNHQVIPNLEATTPRIQRRHVTTSFRFPSVSIFIPFNPKMEMKNKLIFSLLEVADKAISELQNKYPGEMSSLLIYKLKTMVKKLDFNTHRKSLAIFVSPVFEKIYYLNMDIEKRIIVSESLQISDLLFNKKQSKQFHILMLGEKESRIFLSDTNSSIKIAPETLMSKNIRQDDSSVNTNCLTDTATEKETGTKKFLQYLDYSLGNILKHEMLPVFVIGGKNLVEQFKNMTKNNGAIIEYVDGDFEECSLKDLKQLLEPYTNSWQKIKQKNLLNRLKDAANKNRLVFGRENVRHEVMNRKGQMLLMEKQYLHYPNFWENSPIGFTIPKTYNKFSCIKNPIDEMIEKVLESGGNVELVSNGFLHEFSQIALIKNDNN